MLDAKAFLALLRSSGINFFTGVPDSLLKPIICCFRDQADNTHVITHNEGGAIALAVGHYLATGKIPLVYMQNSGLGNALNPLVSLVDPSVYCIPMLLLIGWRGEPGKTDEPQHQKQGEITLELLKILGIPYDILPHKLEQVAAIMQTAATYMRTSKSAYALIVKRGVFDNYELQTNESKAHRQLSREGAIKLVVNCLGPQDIVVVTTGKAGRELYSIREKLGQGHNKDFLVIGSMGHASMIALGIALQVPDKTIWCFDGDAALQMHMGSLATIGSQAAANFKHLVFNNEANDSVGGQPTANMQIDIPVIARACGYPLASAVQTENELNRELVKLKSGKGAKGPTLLEIKVRKGARENLGRPKEKSIQRKEAFEQFVRRGN